MGTLQSFTPLPQSAIILFLYKPSNKLSCIMQSPIFNQSKFIIKHVSAFPLAELLQVKKSSCRKNKILVQENNLLDVYHFVPIFHHNVIIVEEYQEKHKVLGKGCKEIRFQDLESVQTKIYTPLQIQCFKCCVSVRIDQLQALSQEKKEEHPQHIRNSKPQNSTAPPGLKLEQPSSQNKQVPKLSEQQIKQTLNNVRLSNYKRRSTHLSREKLSPRSGTNMNNSNKHENLVSCISERKKKKNIIQILNGRNPCPFNPVSLVISHISSKMTRKIINLMNFYQVGFVRYPSLDVFLCGQCNSTKIVCGPSQLQQISRKVQSEQFPFASSSSSSISLISSQNDSMNVNHQSEIFIHVNDPQFITLYCFCNQTFSNNFINNNSKSIGILKDKLIEIKFFKNILELTKQLLKDRNLEMSEEIFSEIMKDKINPFSTQKLRSNKEALGSIENMDEIQKNQNNQEVPQNLEVGNGQNNEIQKQDSATSLYKGPKYSSTNISKKFSSITCKSLKKSPPLSMMNSLSRQQSSYSQKVYEQKHPNSLFNSTIYFVMHEKQIDRYSIQSLPKKLSRHFKTMKVKKIIWTSKETTHKNIDFLIDRIKHSLMSVLVINENSKVLQEFYDKIEMNAVEDKIVVVKRDEGGTPETLIKKIEQVRQLGVLKLQQFHKFAFLSRSIIVMGSKDFLKHILSVYPMIQIKEFVDITIYKEHRKIREVISRKNQVIVSNVAICDQCNHEYKGLIKSRIIYYDSNLQNNRLLTTGGRGDCRCHKFSNEQQLLPLTSLMDPLPYFVSTYPYVNKKLWHFSHQISVLMGKIKEKKILVNLYDQTENEREIMFLCADSWIIEQISKIIVKIFSTRYSNVWLAKWMTKKVIYTCIQQVQRIVQFYIHSSFSISKNQTTPRLNDLIQKSKQINQKLQNAFSEVENVFDFSQILLELMISNSLFRKCTNYLWHNLLSLNKHEYPLQCSTLLLVLLIGFRKSASMKRNDSINDGTFRSYRKLDKQAIKTNKIDNSFAMTNQKETKTKSKMPPCVSLQENTSFALSTSRHNQSLQFNAQFSPQNQTTINNLLTDEVIQEICQQPSPPTPSLKIYLKLAHFQKPEENESLKKFFISKNNVFSYIYSTEFLVFELIDERQVELMLLASLKGKHTANTLQQNNMAKSFGYPNKFNQMWYDQQNRQSSGSVSSSKSPFMSTFPIGKPPSPIKSYCGSPSSSIPLSPLMSSLLSMKQSNKSDMTLQVEQPLDFKSSKNIEILPSTDQSLIVCVQSMQLLNYNLFLPFYRSQSRTGSSQKKKCFIIPPFTKFEINNNYHPLTAQKPSCSLATHQLKLSPEHQQRFLEKILETFLVEKSQYSSGNETDQINERERSIQVDSSRLFANDDKLERQSENNSPTNSNIESGELFVLKNNNLRRKSAQSMNGVSLLDENFQLPSSDQFFLLMNQFKYFSAHYLLIAHLPKTNVTNAYHAILLSRKGLYYQAEAILTPSNPFKCTIVAYINELRNRMESNSLLQSQTQLYRKKPKVIKWKLTYSADVEKFYLKSKQQPETTYSYNEDSLDVIYKQVLILRQNHAEQQTELNNAKTKTDNATPSDNEPVNEPMIATGTFVNSKITKRKPKKESSIAIVTGEQNESLTESRARQLSYLGHVASTISRRSAVKMSMKSRDSLLYDMNLLQSVNNQDGNTFTGQRRSRVSCCSPAFMFGNKEHKLSNLFSKEDSLESFEKQPHWKKVPVKIDINEEIEEKSSCSSEKKSSESSEDEIEIHKKERQITPINVRTRCKSNFFVDYAEQLRKSALMQKNTSDKAEKRRNGSPKKYKNKESQQNIISYENKQATSNDFYLAEQVMVQDNQELTFDQGLKEKVMKNNDDLPMLFKTFENTFGKTKEESFSGKDVQKVFRKYQNVKLNNTISETSKDTSHQRDLISQVEQKNDEKQKQHELQNIVMMEVQGKNQQKQAEIIPNINQSMSPCFENAKVSAQTENKEVLLNQSEIVSKQSQFIKNDQKGNNEYISGSFIIPETLVNNSKKQSKIDDLQQEMSIKSLSQQKSEKDENKVLLKQPKFSNKLKCRFTLDLSSESDQQQQEDIKKIDESHLSNDQKELYQNSTSSLMNIFQPFSKINIQQTQTSSQCKIEQTALKKFDNSFIKKFNQILQCEETSSDMISCESKELQSSNFSEEKLSIKEEKGKIQLPKTLTMFTFKKKKVQGDVDINPPTHLTENKENQGKKGKQYKLKKSRNSIKKLIQLNQSLQTLKSQTFSDMQKKSAKQSLQSNKESSKHKSQSQSDDDIRSEQNQEFLKTHTPLFLWHNQRQQTQKYLKSSKKLLQSSKNVPSNNFSNKNLTLKQVEKPKQEETNLQTLSRQIILEQIKQTTQKQRSDRNTFTFMKPNEQPQNIVSSSQKLGQSKLNTLQHLNEQSQHIEDFHNQLMNNSSIFINEPFLNCDFINQDKLSGMRENSLRQGRPSKLRYVCEQKKREEGLKPVYQDKNGQDEKFNIVVKTMKLMDQSESQSQNMQDGPTRPSNCQKQTTENQDKLNRSSDKPFLIKDHELSDRRQSYDSWSDEPKNKQSCSSMNYLDPSLIHSKSLKSPQKSNRRGQASSPNSKMTQRDEINENISRLQKTDQMQLLNIDFEQSSNNRSRTRSQSNEQVSKANPYKLKLSQIIQPPCQQLGYSFEDVIGEDGQQGYQIYPQELVSLSPYQKKVRNEQMNSFRKNEDFEEFSSSPKININSLRNLKLNCDIRRKR